MFSRLLFFIALPLAAAPRVVKTIDRDWTFQYFPAQNPDLAPADATYSDARWPAVALPHTWSTYETTGDVHPFIKAATERDDSYWWYGWGWYRKRVAIDPRYSDRLISLEFDGVQKYSKIFVNGKQAAEHKGGYTSFSVDITPYVKFGGENVIAVLVSNRRDDPYGAIPPMTAGNFNVYGGIYRDVRLVIKDRLHFPFQGSAEYEGGAFITTPQVSAASGQVRVRSWVRNDDPQARNCTLVTTISDASNRAIAKLSQDATIGPGETHEFEQSAEVANPHLWSPETPYLYHVHSEIRDGDAIDNPLGFRWFSFNKEERHFYLNGKRITVNGTNRHQEYPWLGDAIPKWIQERDLTDMRVNLGHTFQRTAHYPNDPYVYDLSDRLGIITAEEVPNIKDIAFGRDVQLQNVKEMIRRDRNHPCILMWSMGNETNQPADSAWGHAEDTSRLIHLRRGTNGGDYVQTNNDDIGFENLLRCTVRGWHDGDRDFNDAGHPKNGQVTGTEEWQHDLDREEMIKRRDDNIITFLYADHGADRKYQFCPLLYLNPKGFVDAYRNPKYAYYLWQANYSAKPMLFVEPHNWREQYVGQRKDFTVDSNLPEVTLAVNGRAVGTLKPSAENGHSVVFKDVTVERGVLTAVGQGFRSDVRMAGKPARILAGASAARITAGRNGIATVSATIVDENGVQVIGANPPLTWKVEGEGKLVGPALYQTDTRKNGSYEGEMYIDTPISNVVRSGAMPGVITVTVSSPGLAPGRVGITTIAPPGEPIPGITEPPLEDAGRGLVTRDRSVKPVVFAARQRKLAEITQDYDLSGKDYAAAVRSFIEQRNAGVDLSNGAEFRAMVAQLAAILEKTHGHLVADDYNFLVRQFNDARAKK